MPCIIFPNALSTLFCFEEFAHTLSCFHSENKSRHPPPPNANEKACFVQCVPGSEWSSVLSLLFLRLIHEIAEIQNQKFWRRAILSLSFFQEPLHAVLADLFSQQKKKLLSHFFLWLARTSNTSQQTRCKKKNRKRAKKVQSFLSHTLSFSFGKNENQSKTFTTPHKTDKRKRQREGKMSRAKNNKQDTSNLNYRQTFILEMASQELKAPTNERERERERLQNGKELEKRIQEENSERKN